MEPKGNILNLSSLQLRKAADLQDKIENLQDELAAILNGGEESISIKKRGRPKMRAEGKSRGEQSNPAPAMGKEKGETLDESRDETKNGGCRKSSVGKGESR